MSEEGDGKCGVRGEQLPQQSLCPTEGVHTLVCLFPTGQCNLGVINRLSETKGSVNKNISAVCFKSSCNKSYNECELDAVAVREFLE